jgi:hypothetical protein
MSLEALTFLIVEAYTGSLRGGKKQRHGSDVENFLGNSNSID